MINISKKENFKQDIGHYSLIQSSRIFKENFKLIGLGLMRLKKSLIMEQLGSGSLMKENFISL